jgi:hypothetical protein
MDPERRRRTRRRLWAGAFLIAVGLLVWQTLGGSDHYSITVVLELGPKADTIKVIEGELIADDEVVATFTRNPPIGTPRIALRTTSSQPTLQLRVHLPDRVVQIRRQITAEDDATIYLPLARDLD